MPSTPRRREEYGRRIARAMALIASRPDDPPGLEALAAVATFSPFPVHREVAGETPAETLAHARLSRAAVDLEGREEVWVVAVPPARVAVLRVQGPYAELERVYSWLRGPWLPESGEGPADQPVMEDYLVARELRGFQVAAGLGW